MGEPASSALDQLTVELQELRARAGSPSYADIVARIARARLARGVPESEARPARTTVYDAFRTGRRRLDTALVLDIVRALGADDQEVEQWDARCRSAQRAPMGRPDPASGSDQAPAPDSGAVEEAPPRRVAPRRAAIVLMVGCLALNLLGRELVVALDLPLHLDMVGTATAAVILGPWSGALVGLLTNVSGAAISGPVSLLFAPVNVVGALVWGYGVRRLGLGRTIPRFFVLSVLVAFCCTLIAAPMIVFVLEGASTGGANSIATTIRSATGSLVVAVFSANLLMSLADKAISGFVGLAAAEAWFGRYAPTPGGPNLPGSPRSAAPIPRAGAAPGDTAIDTDRA